MKSKGTKSLQRKTTMIKYDILTFSDIIIIQISEEMLTKAARQTHEAACSLMRAYMILRSN